MEKIKADERWWKYKITDEQIEQIKVGNGEAIRRFWEDNEDLICNIIKGEIRRCYILLGKCLDIWDCISQVYVDLPTYGYRKSLDITYGIFRSVQYCVYGYGRAYVSFDTPLCDGDLRLEDVLVGKYEIEDCYDYSVENERLYYKIALMLFPKSAEKRSNFLRRI